MQKYQQFIMFCLIFGPTSCGSRIEPNSHLRTDLGSIGNSDVVARYEAYLNKTSAGCHSEGTGKRVMVTGFGLFSGVESNISGAIVASMADPQLTPNRIQTHTGSSFTRLNGQPLVGKLSSADHGARVINRSMTVNGQSFEICFVVLDVIWDLAAAIIIREAEAFAPDIILMTGRGGSSGMLEAGALNAATSLGGFSWNGEPLNHNQPEFNYILPDRPANHQSLFKWDTALLAKLIAPIVAESGFEVQASESARVSNDYICNNVSYAVSESLGGGMILLAGAQLQLQPRGDPRRVAGFMHLPSHVPATEQSFAIWIKVIGQILVTTIERI